MNEPERPLSRRTLAPGGTLLPPVLLPELQRPQFFIPMTPPLWSRLLLMANLFVFVAMVAYGYLVYGVWNGSEDLRVLIAFGAKVNPLIAAGQIWRLFTAMFLHIGVIHLLFNLYALYILGPQVEGFFGHGRFLTIYLLAGLFASLASYGFSAALSAGASGAIFGLVGALTVYFLRHRQNFGARGRAILQNMLFVIGINLFIGLSLSGIDNWGHMGGLVGGALVTWGLLPRYRVPDRVHLGSQALQEEDRRDAEGLWVLFCLFLLTLGFWLATSGRSLF